MKNDITSSIPELYVASGKAIIGLRDRGAELGVVHTKLQTLEQAQADLIAESGHYDNAKTQLLGLRAQRRALGRTARAFAMTARDVLKPSLGNSYSQAWTATGFVHSLEVPRNVDELQVRMHDLQGFLEKRPDLQVAALKVTAARAKELHEGLAAGGNGINAQRVLVDKFLITRNAKADAVRNHLRRLRTELTLLIDDMDSRWLTFGFHIPGAPQTPERPEQVTVTMDTETSALMQWPHAARAKHYRVWKRVPGAEVEWIPIGSPSDQRFLLQDLLRGVTEELAVSAVNEGGESRRSASVIVRTLV